ncbi:MAG TPA: DUF3604 domain-containing protein [Planctomycetaceae bacterium]|nr:DUF3604 domain-containing protein [Planctomycetaceae bacterium]
MAVTGRWTRRQWLRHSTRAGLASWWSMTGHISAVEAAEQQNDSDRARRVYFGDLHNHNAVGYAKGSLQRTFEIARNHLDFFAFTPHGWWPDIGHYEKGIEKKWLDGFEVTRQHWPDVLEMVRRFDKPGMFVAIPGFEWHSTFLGDYHILFPRVDAAEYVRINDLRHFQAFAKERGAIMIPHHPANRAGHRGANLKWRDPEVSPVIEIFSEWGCAEHDRAPSPYIRHTEAGRWTRNTLQYYLAQGHRLGVVASTDDHLGYPGAYRQGLAAVWANELTREAIFDALRHRRTYAVSGDRIELDFRVNGRMMGEELPYVPERRLRVAVEGWDQVDRVEVLKNNRVIHRDFPMDRLPGSTSWDEPVAVRFEWGWGPWPALDMTRTCDWEIHIRLEGGKLVDFQPCFVTGPLDEKRRDRVVAHSDRHLRIQSFTALRQQFEDYSQKGVVLKVLGGPDTRISVQLTSPTRVSLTRTFRQLTECNEMLFTGEFPKESAMLHRLVFADNYRTSFELTDTDGGETDTWYYVRVVQANEQFAWSSPIWVDARA